MDTSSPAGQEQVYPTHCMIIPPFEVPKVQQPFFQVGWRGDVPQTVEAADAYAAAAFFQQEAGPRLDGEIVVLSGDGIESVFGYRQTIPTEHLDD